MFNLNSKLGLKANLASTSSHVMSGWVTPRLQGVRSSCAEEDGSLPNQEASNATVFPPFHCWNPCLTEQYYPTAILNFYRYLLKEKCHTFAGIRAVFTDIHYALEEFIVIVMGGGARFLSGLKSRVFATPASRRNR